MRNFDEHKFADRLYLDAVHGEQLDVFLANGWYRMGQTIFTTHFLFFEQRILSAIWLRLGLEGFEFKRSLKKIIKRNRGKFRVEVVPFQLTEEKEAIYQKYAADFKGHLSGSLKRSLLDGMEQNVFQTTEINVYDGDQLVAFSFFDEGQNSITSISGVYDPDYKSYSLGLYTMLEEIQYGIDTEREFYYPGYFVPGNERFDYKLRIGDVQYFEFVSKAWIPFGKFQVENIPINKMANELNSLAQLLEGKVDFYNKFNPFFESNIIEHWPLPYLEYPTIMVVNIKKEDDENHRLVIIYNFIEEKFMAISCRTFDTFPSNYNMAWVNKLSAESFIKNQLIINQVLFTTPKVGKMCEWILKSR